MLVRFADHIFLTQNNQTFIWDTAIGMFRPIHSFGWDGYRIDINDVCYTADPTDNTYGFGTPEMYKVCMDLTNTYESKLGAAPTSTFLSAGDVVWFRDRPITFTPCAPRDIHSWKRLVKQHPRTLRSHKSNRFTKRNL